MFRNPPPGLAVFSANLRGHDKAGVFFVLCDTTHDLADLAFDLLDVVSNSTRPMKVNHQRYRLGWYGFGVINKILRIQGPSLGR